MKLDALVYVAGHRGLAGASLMRALGEAGHTRVMGCTRGELDLTDARATDRFFDDVRPECVILAAGRVGGILANVSSPGDFIRENLQIQTNVIDAAHRFGCSKLLFLGSSCIYPRLAPQPIREDALLTGALEPTNEAYAVAKLAGIAMVQAYRRQYGMNGICAMPTNLYGPGDHFDPTTAHLVPGLMGTIQKAKDAGASVATVWGTGTPRRELMYVDDMARACVTLMNAYDDEAIINVGTGEDLTIREIALTIADVMGFKGGILFDPSKPDGMPRKVLDVSRIRALGWSPRVELRDGLEKTYAWWLENRR